MTFSLGKRGPSLVWGKVLEFSFVRNEYTFKLLRVGVHSAALVHRCIKRGAILSFLAAEESTAFFSSGARHHGAHACQYRSGGMTRIVTPHLHTCATLPLPGYLDLRVLTIDTHFLGRIFCTAKICNLYPLRPLIRSPPRSSVKRIARVLAFTSANGISLAEHPPY
jgi:hypothetical protein